MARTRGSRGTGQRWRARPGREQSDLHPARTTTREEFDEILAPICRFRVNVEVILSPSASEVFAALERAFPKVPINMELAFTEWGRTYPDAAEFRRFATGRTWDSLAARYLETHEDVFGFLGTDALADILPAALAALSRGASPHGALPYALAVVLTHPGTGRHSGLGRRRFDALLARLSAAQQQAVASALRLFIEEHPEAGPTEHIREALDSYWVDLIAPGAEP